MNNLAPFIILFFLLFIKGFESNAQHLEQPKMSKFAFEEILLIDNQTVYVPSHRSFEVELQQCL